MIKGGTCRSSRPSVKHKCLHYLIMIKEHDSEKSAAFECS